MDTRRRKLLKIAVAYGVAAVNTPALAQPRPAGWRFLLGGHGRPGLASVIGELRHHASFPSKFVDPRNVDVWLPPGYGSDPGRRYPVLYMHDGQNIFESGSAFGGVSWRVHDAMAGLIETGAVRPAIVVGVWNTPKRFQEYMPRKAVPGGRADGIKGMPVRVEGEIVSDNYLKFLVTELKPFIDSNYRTLKGRDDTFIMGSSMGGLISAYAVSEYPGIFGGAGCVSTHWPAGDGAVIEYLRRRLPSPKNHLFYFDFGTRTLDALYEPYQKRMDEVMRKAGYTEGVNWITRKFEGEEHSEKSWSRRAWIPLKFLLAPRNQSIRRIEKN